MANVLYDMHCHLDFASNATQAAEAMQAAGAGVFSATVTPAGYTLAVNQFAAFPSVRVGVGLHPWWVADGTCGEAELEEALTFVQFTPFVGEVGLDFGKQHGQRMGQQVETFGRIVERCAQLGGKVVTIHAVRAAAEVLDILEAHNAADSCACILHWYSGSTDQLWRAIRMGCYFSMGAFGVRTGRGREYAKLIPAGQLLLETDEPPRSSNYSYAEMQAQMTSVLSQVAEIRGEEVAALGETVSATSRELLQL